MHTLEVDHGNLYPYNHACWINGKDDPAPPSSTELRDSSGNYLFTKDPAAEPSCCQLYGLAAIPVGTAWPLVNKGNCHGGWAATAQEWMDYLAGWLAGCSVCKAEDQGICLADGYYTISYDPAP